MARTREYTPMPLLSADTPLSRDATAGQQPSNPSNVKVDLVTDMQHQETDSVYLLEPGNLDKLPPYCMSKKSCLILIEYSLYGNEQDCLDTKYKSSM